MDFENGRTMKRALIAAGLAAATVLAAGCGSSGSSSSSSTPAGSGNSSAPVTLRLGYLVNITHASALVGIQEGFFTKELGSSVTLKLTPFSSGTQEATALLAGQLDAAYVGPNPTIKAWQTSDGKLIKVISGAASGGAQLVVKKGITSSSQLKGQSLATPSLGNTQDVALRYWLRQHGLTATATGGGDVGVKPVSPNSAAVLEFKSGQIGGGWEPAPYDIEMVQDGAHPAAVNGLLKGQIEANDFIHSHLAQAEAAANSELTSATGKGLKSSVLSAAFKEITFTDDPIESSLTTDAQHALAVGLLKPVSNISALYDLSPLNKLLAAAGETQVSP